MSTFDVAYRTPVGAGTAAVAAAGVEAARAEARRAAAILTGWPATRIAIEAVRDADGTTLWVAEDQPTPEEWQQHADMGTRSSGEREAR